MQIHVRQWRALLWVATAGLGLVAGFNLWQIVKRENAGGYAARDPSHFSELISAAAGSIDQKEVRIAGWSDYKRLVTVPFNGFVPEKPVVIEEGPKGPVEIPEKPLTDVIKVTAITRAAGDAGRVVVKYKDDTVKPQRDELILAIGGVLTFPYDGEPYHGRLKSIHDDSATFDWFGKEFEVHPMRRDEGPKGAQKGPDAAKSDFDASLSAEEAALLAANKKTEKTIALPNDSGYVIGTKDYDDLSSNAENYLREARLVEQKTADGKKELVVGNIRTNSYLSKTYGLQTGDSLVSINGTPVSNKPQAYAYVRENDSLSKYVVVVRRKGKEVSKTILVNRDKN